MVFFLTKRSETVDHHKGQISLPGGVVKDGESLKNAALREKQEEIGVDPKIIELIGELSFFYISISGFELFPFVGWTDSEPKASINDREVKKIFNIS